jgi:hypothetical protein
VYYDVEVQNFFALRDEFVGFLDDLDKVDYQKMGFLRQKSEYFILQIEVFLVKNFF